MLTHFNYQKLTSVLYSITEVVKSFNSSPGRPECFFSPNRTSSRLAILQTAKKYNTEHLHTLQTWPHTHLLSQFKMFCSHRNTRSSSSSSRAFWSKCTTNSRKQDFCFNFITGSNTHTNTENECMIAHSMNQIFFSMCCLRYTLIKGMLEGAVFNHHVEYDRVFLSSELTSMRVCNKGHNKLKLQKKFFIFSKCTLQFKNLGAVHFI